MHLRPVHPRRDSPPSSLSHQWPLRPKTPLGRLPLFHVNQREERDDSPHPSTSRSLSKEIALPPSPCGGPGLYIRPGAPGGAFTETPNRLAKVMASDDPPPVLHKGGPEIAAEREPSPEPESGQA